MDYEYADEYEDDFDDESEYLTAEEYQAHIEAAAQQLLAEEAEAEEEEVAGLGDALSTIERQLGRELTGPETDRALEALLDENFDGIYAATQSPDGSLFHNTDSDEGRVQAFAEYVEDGEDAEAWG